MDGDGDLDVLGASFRDNEIAWWENTDGSGTSWVKRTIDSTFTRAASVHATDIDGDGDIDVLGAAFAADEVSWWENTDGAGTAWTKHLIDGSFNGARSVYSADVNGDNQLDVLGAARSDSDIVWWDLNLSPTKSWLHVPPIPAPDTGGGFLSILRWIVMESDPSSDEILVAILDWTYDIYLYQWNGAAFTNLGRIETDAATRDRQVMDIAYEQQSGDALIIWGKTGQNNCHYAIWDGTTLGSTGALPSFGSDVVFVRAVADPESDSILVVAADSAGDLNVALWDGDGWTDSIELETSLYANDRQVFDVAWEDSGDEAVVVWSNSTSNQVQYWRWMKSSAFASGTSLTGPDFQAALSTVRLSKIHGTVELALLGVNVNGELYSTLWDGDSFVQSPPTLLSTSVSEPTKTAFDMAEVNTGN